MGGTCTKVNVFKRRARKRSAKIAVMHETTIHIEEKSSSEILKELQNAGLFTNLQGGGLSYMLGNTDVETSKRPRRLPKITPSKKPKSVSDGLPVYSNEEREIMAEIRRQNNLKEKGKMAKIFRERRERVLERRKKNKDLEEERKKEENKKVIIAANETEEEGKQKTNG